MKRTKKISQAEYCPKLKSVSFVEHIQALVNREAEVMHERQEVKLPTYQKPTKQKLTAGLYNFILQLKP